MKPENRERHGGHAHVTWAALTKLARQYWHAFQSTQIVAGIRSGGGSETSRQMAHSARVLLFANAQFGAARSSP